MIDDLKNAIEHEYYLNKNMIRFLLIENLTLKKILFDKGFVKKEEYEQSKRESERMIDESCSSVIPELLRKFLDH